MDYATIDTEYYCGIDLHSRNQYVCIIDQQGKKCVHTNLKSSPELLKEVLHPYHGKISVGVESTFSWYWVADTCEEIGVPFYLGHALYMRAIHVDKFKNDRRDSEKIADLMRAGLFPKAYVYPKEMRGTRDLLRQRMHFVQVRAERLIHLQLLFSQQCYGTPMRFEVRKKEKRKGFPELLEGEDVQLSAQFDLQQISALDRIIQDIEIQLLKQAQIHDREAYALLQTIPGVGKMIAMTILYETHTIHRFEKAGNYASYCRLVRSEHTSSGKRVKGGNSKIGNAYLKNAFTNIISIAQRCNAPMKTYYERLKSKHGVMKARGIIARRLCTTTYYMLKKGEGFDVKRFCNN